jgi:hypothetical protein
MGKDATMEATGSRAAARMACEGGRVSHVKEAWSEAPRSDVGVAPGGGTIIMTYILYTYICVSHE